jgi:hypothetical protein
MRSSQVARPRRRAGEKVRVTLDIPESQHMRLKIAAIRRRTTLQDFMIKLLEREGIRAAK